MGRKHNDQIKSLFRGKMTENELLAELVAELTLAPVDPKTEITVQILCVETGKSENAIRTMLERKVKNGELTVRWANYSGCRVKAYRRAT
jgi:hypothetical protein